MSAAEIDAGEFREGQRRDWNSASRGWREWNELIDETTHVVCDRMVEMAGIEIGESDASSLDFPAESFDAALSRWGIIFDPDGEGAAARVRGFLKPEAPM